MGQALVHLPRSMGYVPPTDDLVVAINLAEDEMEERGLFGNWELLTTTLFRWSTTYSRDLSFRIRKIQESDPTVDLALSGDLINDVETKELRIRWTSRDPRKVEVHLFHPDNQQVVESEDSQVVFDTGKPDNSLYDFLCDNADSLDKAFGEHKKHAVAVAEWLENHLATHYPKGKWAVLDYDSPRYNSWHEFILKQVLTDEDIALSGDILGAEDQLFKARVSHLRQKAGENYVRPTTLNFLGI